MFRLCYLRYCKGRVFFRLFQIFRRVFLREIGCAIAFFYLRMLLNMFFRMKTAILLEKSEKTAIKPTYEKEAKEPHKKSAEDVARVVHAQIDSAVAVEQRPGDEEQRHEAVALAGIPAHARKKPRGEGARPMP